MGKWRAIDKIWGYGEEEQGEDGLTFSGKQHTVNKEGHRITMMAKCLCLQPFQPKPLPTKSLNDLPQMNKLSNNEGDSEAIAELKLITDTLIEQIADQTDYEEKLNNIGVHGGLGKTTGTRSKKVTINRPRSDQLPAEPPLPEGTARWERRDRHPIRLRTTLKGGPP